MVQNGSGWPESDWQGTLLPIVLMFTGLVLIGGDWMGVLSLDNVQNYWPLAVIVVGLADLIAEPKRALAAREEHARQL